MVNRTGFTDIGGRLGAINFLDKTDLPQLLVFMRQLLVSYLLISHAEVYLYVRC